MIKYLSYALTFAEVPDEVSLCINITNCPFHCHSCHSPELQQDTGRDLTKSLPTLLAKFGSDITCVCFMGEGNDIEALTACLASVKRAGFKTALYTGRTELGNLANAIKWLDYLKLGPYVKELGGLASPTTNQRMYRLTPNPYAVDIQEEVQDITYRFWPKDCLSAIIQRGEIP